MFRKSVLLGFCLVFIFSMVLLHGDEDEIQRLRAQGEEEGWTFTVGHTSVSDKPLSAITGLKIPKKWWKKAPFDNRDQKELDAVPSTFDWRDYGKVTSVKNQGSCGSCWAFGMLGSYEGALLIAGHGSQNLSEQYLVRCNSYGYGCNGGWWCFDDMYNGIPTESCYPYTGSDGSCNYSCTKYFPVDSWYHVGSSSDVPGTSTLKQAIYDHGPVTVAVYVNSAFQNYTGGIYNSCYNYSPNHAVVLVGWGSTYWIMKNSWGTGWGESGYMRITFGCSNIGYAAAYAIPEGGTPPPEDPYEPNDSAGAAYGPINSGENYDDAEISTSSDADWFHFTIEDTGTITVSVNHESGEDLDWYLYHSSDTSNWLARGYTTNDPEVGSYNATTTGKYYVRVIGYNGSTSTYTLNVTYPTGGGPGPSGYYRFMNRYSGYAMDTNSGYNYVYQYTYNGNTDKHWEIIDLYNGYHRIDNRASGYSLDTGSGNYTYQYIWNGNTDKHWQIIDLGNGFYRLDNRYNGNSLDVGSDNYVYNYPWNGNTDKQWQIIEID
jgi:hypothetical protein